MSTTTLLKYVPVYCRARDTSDEYRTQLEIAARALDATCGRPQPLSRITGDLVNRHLAAMREAGRSDYYRRQRRTNLLTLLRGAAKEGLRGPIDASRIMKIRAAMLPRIHWGPCEVGRLVAAAGMLEGVYPCGVPRADFWRSVILVTYESGLRMGDVWRLKNDQISAGVITVTQRKTGKPVLFKLSAVTLAAVNKARCNGALLYPWPYSAELRRRHQREIVTLAGLKGAFKLLRTASGTAVELAAPGRGHERLGNTRAVFEKHYLDASALAPLPVPKWG